VRGPRRLPVPATLAEVVPCEPEVRAAVALRLSDTPWRAAPPAVPALVGCLMDVVLSRLRWRAAVP